MNKWEKLNSLPVRDRLRLFFYVLILPFIHLSLGWLGYARLHGFLASHPNNRPTYTRIKDEAVKEAKHTAFLVAIAGRHGLFPATCLRQSLLVFWLLRWRGIQSELRIGVQRLESSVLAHAWIKCGEEVINDSFQVEKYFTAFKGLPEELSVN